MYGVITIFITVFFFVFYYLYVVNGAQIMVAAHTASVSAAIARTGGVYVCGHLLPVWGMCIVEFVTAFVFSEAFGNPLADKMVNHLFDAKTADPRVFQTARIACMALVMSTSMSLMADIYYYPYAEGFSFVHLLVRWPEYVCRNLPFALVAEIFFIQPTVRTVFGWWNRMADSRRARVAVAAESE